LALCPSLLDILFCTDQLTNQNTSTRVQAPAIVLDTSRASKSADLCGPARCLLGIHDFWGGVVVLRHKDRNSRCFTFELSPSITVQSHVDLFTCQNHGVAILDHPLLVLNCEILMMPEHSETLSIHSFTKHVLMRWSIRLLGRFPSFRSSSETCNSTESLFSLKRWDPRDHPGIYITIHKEQVLATRRQTRFLSPSYAP
jgi:uncharacterized Zn-finger protein